jgi:hypothetical protein
VRTYDQGFVDGFREGQAIGVMMEQIRRSMETAQAALKLVDETLQYVKDKHE